MPYAHENLLKPEKGYITIEFLKDSTRLKMIQIRRLPAQLKSNKFSQAATTNCAKRAIFELGKVGFRRRRTSAAMQVQQKVSVHKIKGKRI